jgi:hypothetical protein
VISIVLAGDHALHPNQHVDDSVPVIPRVLDPTSDPRSWASWAAADRKSLWTVPPRAASGEA